MKAEDLMINDWILGLVEDNEQVGKVIAKYPARVTEINRNGDFSAECPYAFDELFDGDGHKIDDFVWYDTEGIPLSKEIFEKLGFERHRITEKGSTREEWWLSDDYYDIVVYEWSDSIWVFRYESCEMNTPHEQRTMSYLHQLQHALHDCGIDKQITF